ncbi:unnamed protein product [Mortierella alpina]
MADIELGQLPRRETDNAIILANATRMYKLHAVPGEVKVVKRGEDKLEKQYRRYCPRCNLPIAYETTPHVKGGAFTYIVQGALNEIQGVPHEDWELELPGKNGDSGAADRGHEDDGLAGHGYDQDQDQDVEMQIRMEGNQNAAASARAFLAASAKASSTSESAGP